MKYVTLISWNVLFLYLFSLHGVFNNLSTRKLPALRELLTDCSVTVRSQEVRAPVRGLIVNSPVTQGSGLGKEGSLSYRFQRGDRESIPELRKVSARKTSPCTPHNLCKVSVFKEKPGHYIPKTSLRYISLLGIPTVVDNPWVC